MLGIIALVIIAIIAFIVLGAVVHFLLSPVVLVLALIAIVAWMKFGRRRTRQ
jgi:hypothetical protein